jgi:hypothetical protein
MKPRVDVRDLHRLNRHRRQGNLHSLIHCDFLSLGQNWGTAPVVSNAVQQGGQQGGAGGGGQRGRHARCSFRHRLRGSAGVAGEYIKVHTQRLCVPQFQQDGWHTYGAVMV